MQPPDLERIPEDYLGAPDVTNIRSAYGEAKRYAEMLCTLYHQRHGLPIHIARPFTFVGPYQDLNAGFAITDFIRDGLQGRPLTIQGDGTTVRSYLYTADLAIWLWTIFFKGESCRAYNIGSEEDITIAELANTVAQSFQKPIEVTIAKSPAPNRTPERYVPSTKRAQVDLGLRQLFNIREAIERTIQHVQTRGTLYFCGMEST